jgi:hypothetical protein
MCELGARVKDESKVGDGEDSGSQGNEGKNRSGTHVRVSRSARGEVACVDLGGESRQAPSEQGEEGCSYGRLLRYNVLIEPWCGENNFAGYATVDRGHSFHTAGTGIG